MPTLTPEAFAEEDNAEAEDFDFDDLELGDDDLNLDETTSNFEGSEAACLN